jgi:hypothetical protein
MRVFKSKSFPKFARKEDIPDFKLCEAVSAAEEGRIDADYGGGVIKQRIARRGEDKAGGYRAIICFRLGERAFFIHCFAKNEKDNISERQEKEFKELAQILLGDREEEVEELLVDGSFMEVFCHEEDTDL